MTDPLRRRPPERALRWAAESVGRRSRITSVRRLTEGGWHANHALTVVDRGGRVHLLVLCRWARPEWRTEDPDFTVDREACALRLLADTADRIRELLAAHETIVRVAGAGPDGLAVLRFRPAIWSEALECYLAELYIVSERRGLGIGRALMEAAIETARALYESLGFNNREGRPDGPLNYFYERDL
jgi:GNAT superfamily N-acetyltransferase